MIFGDPNHFSILIEYLPQWSAVGSFKNGLFHFCIDGNLYPDSARVATLGGDIFCLSEGNALISPISDERIFKMDKKEAFFLMLETMLPEFVNPDIDLSDDFVESYQYQASTYNLEDGGCYVFAVSFKDMIRILGAKLSVLKGDDKTGYRRVNIAEPYISDVVLEKNVVSDIVKSTINFYSNL
ncbi:hypothetical protein SOASR030_22490 [Leminorella grimontii]|uniref:Immunity protein 42 of polymorphic toxin system n=1 Tax=Leminorella grimontii TaxID=82981 RepID=A0AAV5N2Z3_9GAMM|nr:immunity 42 family protein [Leminorella grimontii]KFC96630.1 hypothetical protein GLGR_0992 [Leminorella grimontii ATCC 33999 = DSM 5078]GKX56137.1 hypothetical protein SOASR030_22490 [Leminorella grimontii]VFS57952.1 Uncharacterised protein [Leminorella grimontii]